MDPNLRNAAVSSRITTLMLASGHDFGARINESEKGKDRPLKGLPPDFLSTLLASRIFMRLSLKKAAHVDLVSASSRKSGSPRLLGPTYAGANVGHPFRFVGEKNWKKACP
jgi:hypothetical protein